MHGVVHVEIPAKDLRRAKEWYGKVFGWTFRDMGENICFRPRRRRHRRWHLQSEDPTGQILSEGIP